MANDSLSPGSRQAEKGYRGARLGEPYIYRWLDQEPTSQTWEDVAENKGFLWAVIGLPLCWAAGWLLGVLEISILISTTIASMLYGLGFAAAKRTDEEPVPKLVRRVAYIEYAEGNFYFVLEDDGKARIWQPWELVRQFEKVDYWSMFGDAGASPYKTGWHAIAMTPLVGRPWMIGSTIEGEAYVRERFTELDARFSADTRAQFMRAFEARKSSAERQTMTQTVPAVPETMPDGGVPARPNTMGVPNKL